MESYYSNSYEWIFRIDILQNSSTKTPIVRFAYDFATQKRIKLEKQSKAAEPEDAAPSRIFVRRGRPHVGHTTSQN